ncbi:MAG TPA: ParB/RepB/Spo0J family partition protein [bacterium]|nr:ParB/RepB/Spo0J family partition protein [bacterium]
MIEKKRKLGKGLNALIRTAPENEYITIPLEVVVPTEDQPRKNFDQQRLNELAESIKQYGIIQPIVVKKESGKYRIVAGERRFRAAKIAGLTELKAIIFKGEEDYQISLIENLQREDLNPIEVAEAYAELIKRFDYSQQQLADKVGKSRSEISNCMRLLNLSGKIQDLVRNGTVSVGQARPLAVLEKDEQELILSRIIENHLTARQVEKMAKTKAEKLTSKKDMDQEWHKMEKDISATTNAKVQIKPGNTGISITLNFSRKSDLEKFYKKIKPGR